MADSNLKPTFKKPVSPISKGYQKGFDKSMASQGIRNLNEVDGLLSEVEQSLKKKIFSLAKMEALVFSDPKLSAVYEEMAENGEEKYGYHYNETIQNMIFNDYVLNSPKYLQKYKQAQPKEKKRRDKSGINQLKKKGEEMQTRNLEPKQAKPIKTNEAELEEMTGTGGGGGGTAFNGSGQYTAPLGYDKKVDETTGSASSGAYVGPAVWGSGDLMKTKGKAKVKTTPMVKGGKIIQESNYLVDTKVFENLFTQLNEQSEEDFIKGNSDAYGGVENMNKQNKDIIKNDIKTGQPDKANLETMEETKKIEEKAKSKEQQRLFGMAHAVQKGELSPNKVGGAVKKIAKDVSAKDVEDFASTKHKGLPEKVNELLTFPQFHPDFPSGKTKTNETVFDLTQFQQSGNEDITTANPGDVFISTTYFPDYLDTKGVFQKGNEYRFRGIFGNLASFDDLGDRSAQSYKTLRQPIVKATIEDASKYMKLKDSVNEEAQSMIGDSPDTMANKPTPIGTQSSNMDMGARAGGGMSESYDLMEEINNELKAFSIHQDKLKKMTEDRKPSALVLKDRLGNDNVKNFKSDLKDSSVSKLVDIENSLEYADQQTEIGDNPYKLGQDIEKTALKAGDMKSGEALKNVGNSANDKGDEIPKRNLSKEEQDEVNNYRLGLGDLVYDNEVGERFENRMKADMGDKLYQARQDKLAFRGKAPMYNKDPQPVEDTTSDKVQFNKEQTGWNEREGLKESAVSGRYIDVLGKKRIINFNLNEVKAINAVRANLSEVRLDGMGNSYANIEKSSGSQLNINEAVVKAMNENKFYTDGKNVFSLKNPVQKLNETVQKEQKPVMNEQLEKMKHLTGFKPSTFTDTNSVKKNRGF